MKIRLRVCFALIFFLSAVVAAAHAKSLSLQEVEGDRKIVIKLDKKTKLPKAFLKGKEASAYIGTLEDLKRRVTEDVYSGESVVRHDKSPRYQNLSDGVIFNTGGGKIGYVTRKDGSFTVVIDYPTGRKLKTVDEALYDEYANVISDDCTVPHVFFDTEGREAAIIYLPSSMMVYQNITEDGLVVVRVTERI
ncbi:MAG TPA: hypothetical protein DCL35_02150 [Candidatus Omnitrophica bacterium]|nr:hypothetical protein [Candidatus Omnitrophota bacterium]